LFFFGVFFAFFKEKVAIRELQKGYFLIDLSQLIVLN
jgi:hypothetical protein